MLIEKAYAKVNLVLEVLGRRDDDYHEIASIMQAVSLYDVLTFEAADEIEFTCTAAELQTHDNLVLKAARALEQADRIKKGARIALEKKIPLAAGLGSGSSDAAAALKGLNKLWDLGLTSEKLAEIGAGIGSDVPFFVYGGTCLAEGRGEKITPLLDIKKAWFILLKPDVSVPVNKTASLYRMLEPAHYSSGKLVVSAGASLRRGGTEPITCYNTFDKVAGLVYGGLESYLDKFREAGAGEIHLAGSGPVLYSVLNDGQEARSVQRKLSLMKMDAILVSSVTRNESAT